MHFKGLFTVSTIINSVRCMDRCAHQPTHVSLILMLFYAAYIVSESPRFGPVDMALTGVTGTTNVLQIRTTSKVFIRSVFILRMPPF